MRPKANDAGMFVEPIEALRPIEALSGEYELMGRIGAGGMAELFIARLRGLAGFEKIVVLKRILGARVADPDFVHMFEDEARVAATLAHPNIVTTHDIGHDGDDVFFTMEYLHGETVRRVIAGAKQANEAFPIELALQIAIECAAGLHYAHEHCDYQGNPLGIVHRDVSPSNVVVTYQSGVKLIDFGIAKAASGKHVTEVGMVKGKAAYMSPEQCRSIAVDRRSDVFCLGIMLYEMLAAQRPFNADNALALLGQIVRVDPEPPSRLRPGIPRGLDQIVLRALAKDPAARFESAFAMQEALEMFTREHRLHALPGALGRYLEHLFGPKPYPWLPRERTTIIPSPPVPAVSHSFVTTPRQRIDEGLPTEIPEADATLLPPGPTTTQTRTEPQRPGSPPQAPASEMPHSEIAIAPVAAPSDTTSVRPRRWGQWAALAGGVAGVAVWASFAATGPRDKREARAAPVDVALPTPPQPDPSPAVVASPASAPAAAPALEPATPIAAPTDDGATIVDDVDPTPETPSADRPNDDRKARRQQAQRWIERAQAVVYQDPKQAAAYAEQAIATMPMQAGYSVLGVAACRSGNRSAAQRAFDHLRGNRRTDLAAVCESRGLTLE